jgi:hypothetical protein
MTVGVAALLVLAFGLTCPVHARRPKRDAITTTTTTTSAGGSTTTTTLPSTCDTAVTPSAVTCRINALGQDIDAAGIGAGKSAMDNQVTRASKNTSAAGALTGSKARAKLKRAESALKSLLFRIRALKRQKSIPAATRKSLEDQAQALLKDVRTLESQV